MIHDQYMLDIGQLAKIPYPLDGMFLLAIPKGWHLPYQKEGTHCYDTFDHCINVNERKL